MNLRYTIAKLRGHRHRLALFLFPPLRDHEKLLNRIETFTRENLRLSADLENARTSLKTSREEAQTSAIAARAALDRASQLSLANEQLQSQLMSTTREMADRIERAYGGTFNWAALGGFASRRTPYPWLPVSEPPPIQERNVTSPIGKSNLRAQANAATRQFLDKLHIVDPKMRESAIEAVEAKLQSGEYEFNANGEIVPVAPAPAS